VNASPVTISPNKASREKKKKTTRYQKGKCEPTAISLEDPRQAVRLFGIATTDLRSSLYFYSEETVMNAAPPTQRLTKGSRLSIFFSFKGHQATEPWSYLTR
jgi:hypothetical protein